MGINVIDSGVFTCENTTVCGRSFINLRSDYGSKWKCEFIIRNRTFVPAGGKQTSAALISN